MNEKDPLHSKFQLERIAYFSDAVFAIAITLLIIEIKVPELSGSVTDAHLLHELGESSGKFIGLIIGFMVIGRYWIAHHTLFGYLTDYNRKLIMVNFVFLLSVVFMPFSTAFFSQYFQTPLIIPVIFYVINIVVSGLLQIYLIKIISDSKNHLSHGMEDNKLVNFLIARCWIAPIVFLFSLVVAIFSIPLAYWTPILIPLITFIYNRLHARKHPTYIHSG